MLVYHRVLRHPDIDMLSLDIPVTVQHLLR